jgi:hypothetical protein
LVNVEEDMEQNFDSGSQEDFDDYGAETPISNLAQSLQPPSQPSNQFFHPHPQQHPIAVN